MPANDFVPFAVGAGANVVAQATYLASSIKSIGFTAGVARAQYMNKAARQGTLMAAAVGEFLLDNGFDALDNGQTTDKKDSLNLAVSEVGAGMGGAFRNLKILSTGLTNFVSTITADTVVVRNAAGTRNKRINAVNVAPNINNTGLNGRDAGTLTGSTWYYVYLVYNPTTGVTGGLFSISPTTPTLPTGFTFFVRVGSVRTQAASPFYLLQTVQYGREVRYVVTATSNVSALPLMTSGTVGTASVSTPTYAAVATGNFVPTTAVAIDLAVNNTYNTASHGSIGVAPNPAYSGVQTTNPPPVYLSNAGPTSIFSRMTLESANIYVAGTSTGVMCVGWEENI